MAFGGKADHPLGGLRRVQLATVPERNEDLETRVTALENEMRQVRHDAAAARVLAGGADRDVAAITVKLEAHTRTLNALRETQLEQGQQIIALERKVDDGFAEVRGRLDGTAAGLDQIAGLLNTLIGQQSE